MNDLEVIFRGIPVLDPFLRVAIVREKVLARLLEDCALVRGGVTISVDEIDLAGLAIAFGTIQDQPIVARLAELLAVERRARQRPRPPAPARSDPRSAEREILAREEQAKQDGLRAARAVREAYDRAVDRGDHVAATEIATGVRKP